MFKFYHIIYTILNRTHSLSFLRTFDCLPLISQQLRGRRFVEILNSRESLQLSCCWGDWGRVRTPPPPPPGPPGTEPEPGVLYYCTIDCVNYCISNQSLIISGNNTRPLQNIQPSHTAGHTSPLHQTMDGSQ